MSQRFGFGSFPNANLIQKLSDQYGFIVVRPEGEKFSYYIDSPVDPNSQFERYIAKDVIGHLDSNFRTFAKKEGRSITGLSMGGFGSLFIAANHLDLFLAADEDTSKDCCLNL